MSFWMMLMQMHLNAFKCINKCAYLNLHLVHKKVYHFFSVRFIFLRSFHGGPKKCVRFFCVQMMVQVRLHLTTYTMDNRWEVAHTQEHTPTHLFSSLPRIIIACPHPAVMHQHTSCGGDADCKCMASSWCPCHLSKFWRYITEPCIKYIKVQTLPM